MNTVKNGGMAVNKLILIYLASKMPAGLEHDEIVKIVLDGGWMLYFEMEQYLVELCEDNLLHLPDGAGNRLYAVTAEGLHVLGLLKTTIPYSVRAAIDGHMSERRADMEYEQEITADYTQDSAFEYPVALRIRENRRPVFEMLLTAPSAESAELVCRRFREEGADIFAETVRRLTRDG